jgi:hypothetical protein
MRRSSSVFQTQSGCRQPRSRICGSSKSNSSDVEGRSVIGIRHQSSVGGSWTRDWNGGPRWANLNGSKRGLSVSSRMGDAAQGNAKRVRKQKNGLPIPWSRHIRPRLCCGWSGAVSRKGSSGASRARNRARAAGGHDSFKGPISLRVVAVAARLCAWRRERRPLLPLRSRISSPKRNCPSRARPSACAGSNRALLRGGRRWARCR